MDDPRLSKWQMPRLIYTGDMPPRSEWSRVTPTTFGRCYLYHLFAADGSLLYVGITFNINSRWPQHASKKPWWRDVVTVNLYSVTERDSTTADASARFWEQRAIAGANPRMNITGRGRRALV